VDWREFVASLVGSLAWPLALTVVAALFRPQLAALLAGPLKSLKAGPVSLEWGEHLAEVGVAIASGEAHSSPQLEEELARIAQLVEKTPVVAVRRAFGLIESRLRAIADANDQAVPSELEGSGLAVALYQKGLISAANVDAVRGLATLVNLASRDVVGTSISVVRARDFMVLAQAVLYGLSRPTAGT
jgi:hypothetical protein